MNQAIANLASSLVRHNYPKWQFKAIGDLTINNSSIINDQPALIGLISLIDHSEETRTAIRVNRWLFYLEPDYSGWIVKGCLGRSELTFPYSIKGSSDLNRWLIRIVGLVFWPIVHSSGKVKSILDCPNQTRVSLRYRVNLYKSEE